MRRTWGWDGVGLGLFHLREEMPQGLMWGKHSRFQVGRVFCVTAGGLDTSQLVFTECLPCIRQDAVCVSRASSFSHATGIDTFITLLLT